MEQVRNWKVNFIPERSSQLKIWSPLPWEHLKVVNFRHCNNMAMMCSLVWVILCELPYFTGLSLMFKWQFVLLKKKNPVSFTNRFRQWFLYIFCIILNSFVKKKTRKPLVFVNTSLNKERTIAYWLVLHTYMNIKE